VNDGMTLRRRIFSRLNQLWLVALFGAVLLYIGTNFNDVRQTVTAFSPGQLMLVMLLCAGGRLMLFYLAKLAINSAGAQQTYMQLFPVLALAQLARYLPGGIWHFVGQGAYYRKQGLNLLRVGRVLLLENLWLLHSAILAGSAALIVYAASMASTGGLLLWPFVWFAFNYLLTFSLLERPKPLTMLHVSLVQALMWVLFGLSFAVMLPEIDVWLALGAFIAAWAVGFVTVFAPGGLGTREAILVVLLLPVLPAEQALNIALLHRLLWILTEVVLGLAGVGLSAYRHRNA